MLRETTQSDYTFCIELYTDPTHDWDDVYVLYQNGTKVREFKDFDTALAYANHIYSFPRYYK